MVISISHDMAPLNGKGLSTACFCSMFIRTEQSGICQATICFCEKFDSLLLISQYWIQGMRSPAFRVSNEVQCYRNVVML